MLRLYNGGLHPLPSSLKDPGSLRILRITPALSILLIIVGCGDDSATLERRREVAAWVEAKDRRLNNFPISSSLGQDTIIPLR